MLKDENASLIKGAASAAVAHSSAKEALAQVDELGAMARICASVTAEPPAGVADAEGADAEGASTVAAAGVEVGSGDSGISVIGAGIFIGIVVVKEFVGRAMVTNTWLVLLIVVKTVCVCVLVVPSVGAPGAGASVGAGTGTGADVGAGATGAGADVGAGALDPAAPIGTTALFLQTIPAETA